MKRIVALTLLLALAVGSAACGTDDSPASGGEARTVEVDMVDTAFAPTTLEVDEGETVRFVFANKGEAIHDAFIGDRTAQDQHEEDMAADDGHGGGHDDGVGAVAVEPGETADLTHTFDTAGTLEIGCHQPGHYGAGMKLVVEVV